MTTLQKVQALVEEVLAVPLDPLVDLAITDIDDLDLLDIVMLIEDTFSINLDSTRLGGMSPITCQALATYVEELLA